MWTIDLLKENAKRMLKGYYKTAILASLIVMTLAGGLLNNFKARTYNSDDVYKILKDYGYDDSGSGSREKDYDFSDEDDIEEYFEKYFGQNTSKDGHHAEDHCTQPCSLQSAPLSSYDDAYDTLKSVASVFIVVFLIVVLASLLYKPLFANPLLVGHNRFYLDARMGSARVGNVFSSFGGGRYKNTAFTMFIYDLILWLWGLLAAVPVVIIFIGMVNDIAKIPDSSNLNRMGQEEIMRFLGAFMGKLMLMIFVALVFSIPQLIVRLRYTLVPYILAENPGINRNRAFDISIKTMNGEKAHFLGLQLSFIGWSILPGVASALVSSMTGSDSLGSIVGIAGLVCLYPYIYATYTEFYCCMREKALANGIAYPDELPGGFGAAFANPYPEGAAYTGGVPYQPVNNSVNASGSYPAYNGGQMQDISTPSVIELEKAPDNNTISSSPDMPGIPDTSEEKKDDGYRGPEI